MLVTILATILAKNDVLRLQASVGFCYDIYILLL